MKTAVWTAMFIAGIILLILGWFNMETSFDELSLRFMLDHGVWMIAAGLVLAIIGMNHLRGEAWRGRR